MRRAPTAWIRHTAHIRLLLGSAERVDGRNDLVRWTATPEPTERMLFTTLEWPLNLQNYPHSPFHKSLTDVRAEQEAQVRHMTWDGRNQS